MKQITALMSHALFSPLTRRGRTRRARARSSSRRARSDSDGDDDDVGVVWALDQLSQAMCVVPDMNMFMLDMSCAPPSCIHRDGVFDRVGLGGGFSPRHIHILVVVALKQ